MIETADTCPRSIRLTWGRDTRCLPDEFLAEAVASGVTQLTPEVCHDDSTAAVSAIDRSILDRHRVIMAGIASLAIAARCWMRRSYLGATLGLLGSHP